MNTTTINKRRGCSCAAIDQIDFALLELKPATGFCEQAYSSLINREGLDRCGYREAFPQLLFDVTSTNPDSSAWSLAPAVCYHAFLSLANSRLPVPQRITTRGRCFRNEEYTIPERRQIEFDMREFILIGHEHWIESQLEAWQATLLKFAAQIGIDAQWQSASDPFFLPLSKGRALMQRLLNTKIELCLSDGLAITSINRHRSHFTDKLSIIVDQVGNDAPIGELKTRPATYSACIAFGLDRWAWAERTANRK
jgi:hypothetical protein